MFDRDVINNYEDDTGTVYTCPHCQKSVKFYIQDFDKHLKSEHSNLTDDDYVGAPAGKAFLDFYCPECSVPTTVIFSHYAGGQHGEYWYEIDRVEN